jgi:hypothetical protein
MERFPNATLVMDICSYSVRRGKDEEGLEKKRHAEIDGKQWWTHTL